MLIVFHAGFYEAFTGMAVILGVVLVYGVMDVGNRYSFSEKILRGTDAYLKYVIS